MMLMNNVASSMEQHPASVNMGKCVESSGVSAKVTAVLPIVFQQLKVLFAKQEALKRGGAIRESAFLLALGPRA